MGDCPTAASLEEAWSPPPALLPVCLQKRSCLHSSGALHSSACPLCMWKPGKCQARLRSGQLDQLGSCRQARKGEGWQHKPTLGDARRCFCLDTDRWMLTEAGAWMQKAGREPTARGKLGRLMHLWLFCHLSEFSSVGGGDSTSPAPRSLSKAAPSNSFEFTSERRCAPCANCPQQQEGNRLQLAAFRSQEIWAGDGLPGEI